MKQKNRDMISIRSICNIGLTNINIEDILVM